MKARKNSLGGRVVNWFVGALVTLVVVAGLAIITAHASNNDHAAIVEGRPRMAAYDRMIVKKDAAKANILQQRRAKDELVRQGKRTLN